MHHHTPCIVLNRLTEAHLTEPCAQFPEVTSWDAPSAALELVPGGALFVPAGAVFSLRRAASPGAPDAACLLVALPQHTPWAATMVAALDAAQDAHPELAPDRRVFPHAPGEGAPGGALRGALGALFAHAAEEAAAAAPLRRAAGLSGAHYDVAEHLRRYDLEALLDAGGGICKVRSALDAFWLRFH